MPGHRLAPAALDALAHRSAADGLGRQLLDAAVALHQMAQCDPAGAVRARAAFADGALVRQANGEGAVVCGWLTLIAADDPTVVDTLAESVRQASLHGSVRALAAATTFRALARLRAGELVDAEQDARQSLELALTGRVDMDPSFAGAYLADALTERGEYASAGAVFEIVGVSTESAATAEVEGPRYYLLDALARWLLRQARPREAVAVARRAGEVWLEYGFRNPALGAWRSELALGLFALGAAAEAELWAAEELELAQAWGAPGAVGRALRVHGQIIGGANGLDQLAESVGVLDGTSARLGHARSLVEYGSALRRSGLRTDARRVLSAGLDAAEVCGAVPLREQASTELRAAGFRPRRQRLSGPRALTPSERRVAELAAAGDSNRDISQALFITVKTVELHLTNAYRKLGVSRRGQLAHALAG